MNACLVSVDLYKFCQRPLAHSYLKVDQVFCKALAQNNINHEKFANVSHLKISFMFRNSHSSIKTYGDFESKYYFVIAQIISKSVIVFPISKRGVHSIKSTIVTIMANVVNFLNGSGKSNLI